MPPISYLIFHISILVSCAELVSSLLSNFLLVVDHMENHSAHMTALIAALSVLLTLVDNESLASPSGIHEAKAKLTGKFSFRQTSLPLRQIQPNYISCTFIFRGIAFYC